MSTHRFWISYDVSDDHRRSELSRLLSGYGVRVQYSAFECVLSAPELRRLLKAAGRQVRAPKDSLLVGQCATPGKPGHRFMGQANDHKQDYWVV